MKNSILTILTYLFKYYLFDNREAVLPSEKLTSRLHQAGFSHQTIHRAMDWLNHLADDEQPSPQSHDKSIRIFSQEECRLLSSECRGFLIYLEQENILTPFTRELVIRQIMALDCEDIDLPLTKWVTLIVLFNTPGQSSSLSRLEFLILDEIGEVH